ncbi:MAG: hypothetical protein WBK19_10405 [Azonexus sp.]
MTTWTKEQEGEELRKRFEILKKERGISRAEFARTWKLKGGDSMINQHITAHRPMNMDAAVIYAKGFGCDLKDISQRLALEAAESASVLHIKTKTVRESRIDSIIFLLNETDDFGLVAMLEKAKDVARDYPLAKQTQSSSG